jgi:hypothetical protein
MANARPAPARSSDKLEEAFDEIERAAPDSLARGIRWMRKPKARIVRLPLGILCIAGSSFWFLPVLGLWFLPLGLLLIAQDVPFLRRPVGRMTLYLLERWKRLRKWWAQRKQARAKRLHSEPR